MSKWFYGVLRGSLVLKISKRARTESAEEANLISDFSGLVHECGPGFER